MITIFSGKRRCGTSMLGQMLRDGGMRVLDDGRSDPIHNPRGFMESQRVLMLDPDFYWLDEAEGAAVKFFVARLSWLPRDRQYKVILIDRDPVERYESEKKMGCSLGLPPKHFRLEHKGTFDSGRAIMQVNPQTFQFIELFYSDVIADPAAAAAKINAFLGGHLDEMKMAAAVDPSLYRNRLPA